MLPTSVAIAGIDGMKILNRAFEAVQTFQPMDEQQERSLLAKTAEAAHVVSLSHSKLHRFSTALPKIPIG